MNDRRTIKSLPQNVHSNIHKEDYDRQNFRDERTDYIDAPAIFVYVQSHDATKETNRIESNRIESQLSEALAAKRRLNARDSYDADDAALASAPRVGRLFSLSFSHETEWRREVVEASSKVRR